MGHKKPVRIDPLTEKLALAGCDSHAHLDSKEFDQDRAEVIRRAAEAGVKNIGNVFLGPEEFEAAKDSFMQFTGVFFILGIHPCDGLRCTADCIERISALFTKEKNLKAVGEIGLDYHWNDCPREVQRHAFAMQLEMAKALAKPVVIHCREAEDDCLALLEGGGFSGYPLLWHCFGGDKSLAKRIIRNGWHISVPGSVTYPANSALREAVAWIPEEHLLLETDCPYLSPVPWRGTRNEPAYIVFTARCCAEARNEDPEKLWQTCGDNARAFFNVMATL